jgi:hypothetical protein
VSPPGLEHYFRDLAAGLGDIATQEASIPLRKQLSEKHDIEVVGEAVPSPRRGEG